MIRRELYDKKILAWALYDWANSAFATTVLAGFFPILFKGYWNHGVDAVTSTHRLANLTAFASLVVALLSPVLGSIADRAGTRKRFLMAFTLLGASMTGALWWVGQGEWLAAATLFGLAQVGFFGGLTFYDSLIMGVAPRDKLDFVSGYGYSLGYLGGGLLFTVNVMMVMMPDLFGIASVTDAARISIYSVAAWWVLFSLPIFLFVPEPPSPGSADGAMAAIREGLLQLKRTFDQVRAIRAIGIFLLAYWFYIDGVDTIIRMAVDYGLSLGFKDVDLIAALLIVQFVGFPAALAFGWLGERIGPKRSIYIGLVVYSGITLGATFMDSVQEFYAMAAIIGLVQGGVQSLSRSYYAQLIPADKAGEFFGFYNMLGKFAAVIGPALMGLITIWFGNPRLGILSILLLFLVGGTLLYWVDEPKRSTAA